MHGVALLAIIVSVLGSESAVVRAPATAEWLVEANRSAIDLIHTIDLELQLFVVEDGKESKAPASTWRWSKRGALERIRYVEHEIPPNKEGLPVNLVDALMDGSFSKLLYNWDVVRPQKITPTNQGTVTAVIEPQSGVSSVGRNPPGLLLFSFQLTPRDARLTLRELLAASLSSELVGRARVGGSEVYQVRFAYPGADGRLPGSYFDVFIDPAVNFLARRVVGHVSDAPTADGGKVTYGLIREVMRFEDFGDGVFVPLEVEQRFAAEGFPDGKTTTRIYARRVTVNEPLPADSLNFSFPEYALVRTLPPVNGKVKVEVWGPDNAPLKEISDTVDLEDFRYLDDPPLASHGRVLLAANIAVLGLLGCGLFFARWLRRRKGAVVR